jgi:hypothetical protein
MTQIGSRAKRIDFTQAKLNGGRSDTPFAQALMGKATKISTTPITVGINHRSFIFSFIARILAGCDLRDV